MDDVRRLIHLPEKLLLIIAMYLSFQDCILLHEVNKLLNGIFPQIIIMKNKGLEMNFINKDNLHIVQFYHLIKFAISKWEWRWCNEINSTCIKVLSKALETNNTLIDLSIHRSSIGEKEAKLIGNALKINTTLTELDLSNNNIDDKGTKEIALALATNTTLKILNLAYNKIYNEGAITLEEAMKTNTTLEKLYLNGNKISFGIIVAIEIASDRFRTTFEIPSKPSFAW